MTTTALPHHYMFEMSEGDGLIILCLLYKINGRYLQFFLKHLHGELEMYAMSCLLIEIYLRWRGKKLCYNKSML